MEGASSRSRFVPKPYGPLKNGQPFPGGLSILFTGQICKAQVAPAQEFGGIKNLARVEGEVFRHVTDRIKSRNAEPLNGMGPGEIEGREPRENPAGFGHGLLQVCLQPAAGKGPALGEFFVALATVWRPA